VCAKKVAFSFLILAENKMVNQKQNKKPAWLGIAGRFLPKTLLLHPQNIFRPFS